MSNSQILKALNEEIFACKSVIKNCRSRISVLPKGSLRVSIGGKVVRYYYCKGNSQGIYISKKNCKFASDLARREKNEDAIERASGALTVLIPAQNYFETNDWRDAGSRMHPEKIKLAEDEAVTVMEKARKWEKEPYEKYEDFDSPYITKKGENVRSKSELIIANILYDNGIPYHYEQILHLRNGRHIVPDFTIFDIKNERIVYLEHFGMLSDEQYSRATVNKMNMYTENGYVMNKDLFCTFESDTFRLPTLCVEKFLVKNFAA